MEVIPLLVAIAYALCVIVGIFLIIRKLKQKYKLNLPLAIWNGIAMLPIVFAPLVFFASAFFFDNPSTFIGAVILYLLVNSYSILLFWCSIWSARFWAKGNKVMAWGIPSTLIILIYGLNIVLSLIELLQ